MGEIGKRTILKTEQLVQHNKKMTELDMGLVTASKKEPQVSKLWKLLKWFMLGSRLTAQKC